MSENESHRIDDERLREAFEATTRAVQVLTAAFKPVLDVVIVVACDLRENLVPVLERLAQEVRNAEANAGDDEDDESDQDERRDE